ncbi:MAG: exonuclease SbcCD subunit D [Microthrixaceae bacterium]
MVKFIHTADWQLGMTRHFLAGEAQARFTEARIEAISEIGQLAVNERCSFVVVAGDVFETNHIERQVILRALDAMAATPQVTFYLLPGNHDPLDAASVFTSAVFEDHRPDNVVVLADDKPVAVEVPAGERAVEVVGAPWSNKAPTCDLVSAAIDALGAGPAPSGGPVPLRVVVGHGAIDYMYPDADYPAVLRLESLESAVDARSAHYVALGDRHSVTEVGRSGRIWYCGSPEPTDYDEEAPGQVLVVELTDDTVTVDRHHVARWSFERRRFDVSSSADIDAVGAYLENLADKQRTIVKLGMVGQLSLGEHLALEELIDLAGDRFAAIERWELETDLVVVPDEIDFETMGLTGFASAALEDLQGVAAGTPPGDLPRGHGVPAAQDATDGIAADPALAQDAMRLLYRLNASGSADRTGVLS